MKMTAGAILLVASAMVCGGVVAQAPNDFSPADKAFLTKAAEGGMAEVKLGQLAAEKGSTQAVRDFGQKMVHDHAELNESMKPIAASAGVTPPMQLSPEEQAEYDKLDGLSGAAFDHEYVTNMVKDHRTDLHEFRHEVNTTQNAQLKDAVSHGEQVIHEHLLIVLKLAHSMDLPIVASPAPVAK